MNNYIDLGLSDPFEKLYLNGPSNTLDALNNIDNYINKYDFNPMNMFKSVSQNVQQWLPTINKSKNNGTGNIGGSLKELLDREGVHYRITSGYRPGARTKQGRASNHSKQDGAYDIVPANGYSWDTLKKEIYGNKTIVDWMNNRGWGIIDETVASSKAKTGATGDHWHFGPDSWARKEWQQNLARYGQSGMKFQDTLAYTEPSNQNTMAQINPDSSEFKNKFLDYLDELDSKIGFGIQQVSQIVKEMQNPLTPVIKPKQKPVDNTTTSNYTGAIPDLIHKMIPDKQKADILTNIAHKESGFKVNAKNPVSTASGLFQQTNANKKQYGYGPTAEAQIQAASRFYDDNLRKINSLVSQYGNRGKSLQQLMYAYWFNPKGAETFIKTGKDVVTDKQGTTMTNVLNRLA